MSGLGEYNHQYGFVQAGAQVQQSDIDQYVIQEVEHPIANFGWFGTAIGTGNGVNTALVKVNQLVDWPRNPAYSITGITNGTYGGTFTANFIDQFGVPFTESVTIGTAVNGGTTYGTQIAMKFISGSFSPVNSAGTFIGTASVGLGTASNGSASSNWFGLMTKIGGTADVKNIVWDNNGTITTLNKGTAIGTLVNATTHSFQGTSGVAITDRLMVMLKSSWNNTGKGTLSNL